jgi:hypothetical protein
VTDDEQAQITTLQQQQSLFTQALVAALAGRWTGGPTSVEAFLYALDPQLQGTLDVDAPVVQSEL